MRQITPTEFAAARASNPYLAGRWDYYAEAIRLVGELAPDTALEIGPGPLPLFHDSLRMDIAPGSHPTIVWDAGATPWPMGTQTVDVIISLQCWEHLAGRQRAAFQEAVRVARRAIILSVPWRWNCTDAQDCHHALDEAVLEGWTGRKFDRLVIVPPHGALRGIFVYRL